MIRNALDEVEPSRVLQLLPASHLHSKWLPISDTLAKRFEGKQPQDGSSIVECYDLNHYRPKPEYERIYLDVRKQLAEMGLVLN